MTEDDSGTTRRSVLKATGAVGAAAAVGGASVLASEPAAAASANFTASKVTAQTDDGRISSVYFDPMGTVTWENFDESIEEIRAKIDVKIEGVTSWKNVIDQVFAAGGGTDGEWTFSESYKNTLYSNEGASPFEQPTDGEWKEQNIIFRVTIFLRDAEGNVADPEEQAEFSTQATMPVAVKNRPADAGMSGTANGGIKE